MVKKFVTSNIIDNLTFYVYGRLERELEGMAERTGLPKSDFANRLSTLLSNQVVEVWDGKIFIASIYPADPGSIRIISKYSHKVTDSNPMEVRIDWAGESFKVG